MKLSLLFAGIVVAALAFAGCQDESAVAPPVGDDPNVAAMRLIDEEIVSCNNDGMFTRNRNFIGVLSGDNEVPPNDSKGRGVAKFKLSKDGSEIRFKLIVANISNVIGAHIHKGGAGENGPVVFELFHGDAAGGRVCGPIAEGTFTPADLGGPYEGDSTFAGFLADLHADSLYVNVHTSDGVDSTVGLPGDLPAGEIRGQLRSHPWKWHGWGWGHDKKDDDDDQGDDHDGDNGHGHGNGNGHGNGHGKKHGHGRGHGG